MNSSLLLPYPAAVLAAPSDALSSGSTELRESEALFRATFENAAVGIAHVAPDGSLLRVNSRLCDILGYPAGELVTKTFQELTHPDDCEANLAQLKRALDAEVDRYSMEKRYLRKGGSVTWARLTVGCVRNADRTLEYLVSVVEDISEQKRAEMALGESREDLERAQALARIGSWRLDVGCGKITMSGELRRLFGDMKGLSTYKNFLAAAHPGDRKRIGRDWKAALKGAPFDIECRLILGGKTTWIQVRAELQFDSQGRLRSTFGTVQDISDKKEAEEQLRESEERLRLSNQAAGIGTFTADFEAGRAYYSPELAAMLGAPSVRTAKIEEAFARVHGDDVQHVRAQYNAALNGNGSGLLKVDFRIVRPDGEIRWMTWAGRVEFRERPSGRIPFRVSGACVDITERKRQEDQIRLLMREVNHRSKNMLTLVQAIARQTLTANPDDFLDRFAKRIEALSEGQDLLVKNAWKGADLNELVKSQLAHFEDLIGTRIKFHGPALFVSASAAQAIGMALHELATNAGKHGALANGDGRVVVEWCLERSGAGESFVMTWREQGGHRVVVPAKRGFGSTVICEMAEMSLGAKVELHFRTAGVVWLLSCAAGEILMDGNPIASDKKEKPAESICVTDQRPRILVVDDEAIVALEISGILLKAGFEVVGPARAVSQSLSLINEAGCDAAVLDFNLGSETSEPVALRLTERGTPFVTVSGYSRKQLPAMFAGAPALTKPLRPEHLITELRKCIKASLWGGLS